MTSSNTTPATIPFGQLNSEEIQLLTIKNKNGLEALISTYGATLVSLLAPDSRGNLDDIVLGYDNLEDYLNDPFYMGSNIGRCSNRIALGQFKLEGKSYQLQCNNGANHLHGGHQGFNKKKWCIESHQCNAVVLSYTSAHLEEGYPGNLQIKVQYKLLDNNALDINFEATSDLTTICNPTNHSYFNLAGYKSNNLNNHYLQLNSNWYTETNAELLPTGKLVNTSDSPLHFKHKTNLHHALSHCSNAFIQGLDHNFKIETYDGTLQLAAVLSEHTTGRKLCYYTSMPGVQVYTGNHLDGAFQGKHGRTHLQHSGVCLETQYFPNAINQDNFLSPILEAGTTKTYYNRIELNTL